MSVHPASDTIATAFYDEHKRMIRIESGVLGNNDSADNEWYYNYFSREDLTKLIEQTESRIKNNIE